MDREHHAGDARFDQRVNAWRGSAVMAARLEGDVCRCTCNGLFGRAKGYHLGVRLAGALVEAFADDAIAFGDDTSNPRVRMRCIKTAFGESQCPRHRESIKFSEHYVTRKRPSLTGPLSHAFTLQRNTTGATKPSLLTQPVGPWRRLTEPGRPRSTNHPTPPAGRQPQPSIAPSSRRARPQVTGKPTSVPRPTHQQATRATGPD